MSRILVQSEKVIPGKPEDIYAILADYKEKHQRILPQNFQDYSVESGGRGSGTVISYRLLAGGRERPYRMRVTEPVKGRTLTESDMNSSLVTTWTLTPQDEGRQTKVRVATLWEGGSGVGGFFERTFAPLGLRRIYASILAALEQMATGRAPEAAQATPGRERIIAAGAGATLFVTGCIVALVIGLRSRGNNKLRRML